MIFVLVYDFAYVLVSDNLGGYTERRIAVATNDFGVATQFGTPKDFQAPTAGAPSPNALVARAIRSRRSYDVNVNDYYIIGYFWFSFSHQEMRNQRNLST